MLYYMFPYYGSECLSNNKSHSSNKFLHKKIPKTNQGSSNAQQKYILKHRHTHAGRCWSYCNPPATSWSEWRTKVFVWSARVLSFSLLHFFWSPWLDLQTCCSYSWDSKHKHGQYTASWVIGGFQGALTKTHTKKKKDSGTKSQTLGIKNSLWVGV